MKTVKLLHKNVVSIFQRTVCSGQRLTAVMGFGKDIENRVGVGTN